MMSTEWMVMVLSLGLVKVVSAWGTFSLLRGFLMDSSGGVFFFHPSGLSFFLGINLSGN